MCNKPCIYRQTGEGCQCEKDGWEEDEKAQSQEEDDADVQIGMPDDDDVD